MTLRKLRLDNMCSSLSGEISDGALQCMSDPLVGRSVGFGLWMH